MCILRLLILEKKARQGARKVLELSPSHLSPKKNLFRETEGEKIRRRWRRRRRRRRRCGWSWRRWRRCTATTSACSWTSRPTSSSTRGPAPPTTPRSRSASPRPPSLLSWRSFLGGPRGVPIPPDCCSGSWLEDSRYRSAGWPAPWCGVPGSVEVVAGALLELPLVLR